jgi:4,5-dihydroxyphthalate decarboxylase
MSKLQLSIAVGDYDRVRPLIDGTVAIDGVAPVPMILGPEEIFFRAFRHAEFDIAELSLSSFTLRTARGDNPYLGVPVFPSRSFRHSGVYIRTDRGIRAPADLKGRRVGLAEYQLTANVWVRAFLDDDFGVAPAAIEWVRGGVEEPGRPEKIPVSLPPDVVLHDAPAGRSLSEMLLAGETDAVIGPRAPSALATGKGAVGWLFADPRAAAIENYRRTRIFPIMHVIGVRRTLVDRHPWLPAAVLKAFEQAKAAAWDKLADPSASKVMLPFIDQLLVEAQGLLGPDPWPYGVDANRQCLEYFLDQHHKPGLSARRVALAELFPPSTLEAARI